MTEKEAEYVAVVQRMVLQARRWIETHKGLNPKVQFNVPPNVNMIVDVETAIRRHIISLDAVGSMFVNATCRGIDGPTLNQLKATLEFLEKPLPPMIGSPCPSCNAFCVNLGGIRVARNGVMPEKPEPVEDLTGCPIICASCGAVNFTDENRQLRKPTDQELAEMQADPDMVKVMNAAKEAAKQVGNKNAQPKPRI